MTNLLSETVAEIGGSAHTVADVAWVGSYDGEYAMSWAEFEPIARATQFDSGYGGAEIAPDLVVVFTDGEWLERGEYDGSEWWAHKRQPKRGEGKPFPQAKIIDYEYSLAGIVSKCESSENPDA